MATVKCTASSVALRGRLITRCGPARSGCSRYADLLSRYVGDGSRTLRAAKFKMDGTRI